MTRLDVPRGQLAGMTAGAAADPKTPLHVVVELSPRGDLEALAARAGDPAVPEHRGATTLAELQERFGRRADGTAVDDWLRAAGAADAASSADGLVVGGHLDVAAAERLFKTRFVTYTDGTRHGIAPDGPITLPFAGIRDVRGLVAVTTPRFADVVPRFTNFRGDWFLPAKFRELVGAVPDGGTGERVTLIEDASDKLDITDVAAFLAAEGAPPNASASRVHVRAFASKTPGSACGRDDRGQESTLDVDAVLTLAPAANVVVQDDDVCNAGDDGTLALARAIDGNPTVIVMPFVAGAVRGPSGDAWGRVPLPLLEAQILGIPVVVPSGDDGAYGYRDGVERPGIAYPCVLAQVVCAGGTQIGDRLGQIDEAPWNDRDHAGGGGISADPRPSWQDPATVFELRPGFVRTRIVPDLAADASGHLRVLWRGYREGGIGGTSESAALAGAEIAAVNGLAGPGKRIRTTADLYALAKAHPEAFRTSNTENDRGFVDNTLRPRLLPPPKTVRIVPASPPPVLGCPGVQKEGCAVTATGYNPIAGLGDLLETKAAAALR